jgi:uncharacterized protein
MFSQPRSINDPDVDLVLSTGREILRRLRTARNPEDIFAVIQWGYRELDRTYARTDKAVTKCVACKTSCSYCCHVALGVQAHEVLVTARFIRKHFTAEEIARVVERAAKNREQIKGLDEKEAEKLNQRCPLLCGNDCSVYEARPEVCRAHHAFDAKQCEKNLITHEHLHDGRIMPLRMRMRGVMLGIDHALVEAGYDGRAYDFGSALHEALTTDVCQTRWLERKQTFPDSCREPPLDGATQSGEIQRGTFRGYR